MDNIELEELLEQCVSEYNTDTLSDTNKMKLKELGIHIFKEVIDELH